jgi:hypothetical protein
MAQDFYGAFHLGGTDSLGINSISIDGVNMAGVKALEKRTREMKTVLESVQKQNALLMEENRKLQEQLAGLKNVSEEAAALRLLKAEMLEQLNIIKAKNKIEVSAK